MTKENLTVGILINPDYNPSLLAGTHIQTVLKKEGIKTIVLSLDDVMDNKINCDTVFNVYYGEIGDGGIVSGILKEKNIAFVGNSQYTCSIMLNKIISKMIFKRHGYLTPEFWYQPNTKTENNNLIKEIENNLSFPLLVKQVNGAASENIHLISDHQQLESFVQTNRVLIDSGYYFFEQFIKGRELSAGYINALDILLPVIEIHLIGQEYQSNKVKFTSGLKENIIPAKINKEIYDKAQMIAKDLNSIFHCEAFSRTDMIYDEEKQELYLLEINTNPGLLEKSLLPLMGKVAGINESDFFLKLIQHSLSKCSTTL